MTILYFLILLSVIIVIHECGHLLAAKKFGVYCYEFSFGMGPLLWKKKTAETQYSIRAIPMGGYVSMAGEQDGDELYPDVEVPPGRRITDQVWWKKIIIMIAGVTMNFILAWVLFSLVYLSRGVYYVSPESVVGEVQSGLPAETAGFEPGDRIIAIAKEDGSSAKVKTFLDMQVFCADYSGVMTYTVERNGQQLEIEVQPVYDSESETYRIGIVAEESRAVDINVLNCWYYGGVEMKEIAVLMFRTIGSLLQGRNLDQLSGPVGIYQATGTYASMGLAAFLFLMAQLSLNVGLFNLLPLPVLDGGQIVITLCETAVHRELNEKVKMVIMGACWALLIGLMVFITWNDIAKLLG